MIHKKMTDRDYSEEAKKSGVTIPIKKMLVQCSGDLFRDEAIDRVEENADQEWMNDAMDIVRFIVNRYKYFSTDDIWHMLKEPTTHDNRAMGAVMRKAQAEGWIEPTDRVVKSTRPVCHSRPIRVWRSKLI